MYMETNISFAAIAYFVVLYTAAGAGIVYLKKRRQPFRLPLCTIILSLLIAAGLAIQLSSHGTLELFQRDMHLVLQGQIWRTVTPLFFQDGALAGGVLNLINLLVIGTIAENILGRKRWLLMFFGAGIAMEILGSVWDSIGAGNSIANFGLAAGIISAALKPKSPRTIIFAAVVFSAATLFLLISKDIHGLATMIGLIISVIYFKNSRSEKKSTTS